MQMETTKALRNAIISVLEAKDRFDCDETCLATMETLYRLLFAAEEREKGETTNA